MEKGFIYELVFPNNKRYIGQTVNYNRRLLEYYSNFNTGKLKSKQPKLYNAINKYNWGGVIKNILEEIDSEDKETLQTILNEKEIYYISKYNSAENGYNISNGGNQGRLGVVTTEETKENLRNAWTPELREKLSKLHKGKKSGNALNTVAVLQYNLDGLFISEYESISEAARAANGATGNISKVCSGQSKYSCNSIWKYKESEDYPKKIEGIKLNKKQSLQKEVLQFTKEGILIKEYKNLKEASEGANVSSGALSNCCLGKSKSSGGFIWKYK